MNTTTKIVMRLTSASGMITAGSCMAERPRACCENASESSIHGEGNKNNRPNGEKMALVGCWSARAEWPPPNGLVSVSAGCALSSDLAGEEGGRLRTSSDVEFLEDGPQIVLDSFIAELE